MVPFQISVHCRALIFTFLIFLHWRSTNQNIKQIIIPHSHYFKCVFLDFQNRTPWTAPNSDVITQEFNVIAYIHSSFHLKGKLSNLVLSSVCLVLGFVIDQQSQQYTTMGYCFFIIFEGILTVTYALSVQVMVTS